MVLKSINITNMLNKVTLFNRWSSANVRPFKQTPLKQCPLTSLTKEYNKSKSYCNKLFNFEIEKERIDAVIAQIQMHAGINNILKKHGLNAHPNCKMAIEVAKTHGLICNDIYHKCSEINKKGNDAKHKW